MNEITISPITESHPFDTYPHLKTIWPEDLQALAQEATNEELAGGGGDLGLFFIRCGEDVIGITGYFYCGSGTEPFLRWHGVVPKMRRRGYSARAMDLVVQNLLLNNPDAEGLTELVPSSSEGPQISAHFAKLGFEKHGASEKYDWSDYTWQPYRLNLIAL